MCEMKALLCIGVTELRLRGLFRHREAAKESERVRILRGRGCGGHDGGYQKYDQIASPMRFLVATPALDFFAVVGKGAGMINTMAMTAGGHLAGHQTAC